RIGGEEQNPGTHFLALLTSALLEPRELCDMPFNSASDQTPAIFVAAGQRRSFLLQVESSREFEVVSTAQIGRSRVRQLCPIGAEFVELDRAVGIRGVIVPHRQAYPSRGNLGGNGKELVVHAVLQRHVSDFLKAITLARIRDLDGDVFGTAALEL